MPWIIQMLTFALMLLGIGLAIWVSFWLMLFLLVSGLVLVSWAHIKLWLLQKGILNPTPGVPFDAAEPMDVTPTTTIIETDYTRIDSK